MALCSHPQMSLGCAWIGSVVLFPGYGDASNIKFRRQHFEAKIRAAVLRIRKCAVPNVKGGRFPFFGAIEGDGGTGLFVNGLERLGGGVGMILELENAPLFVEVFQFNPDAIRPA